MKLFKLSIEDKTGISNTTNSGFVFKRKPFKHQEEMFYKLVDRFINDNKPFYGLLWEMGVAKTKVILDIGRYLFDQGKIEALLIIAPSGVHENHAMIETKKDIVDNYISAYWSATARKVEKKQLELININYDHGLKKLKVLTANTDALRYNKKKGIKNRSFDFLYNFVKTNRCMVVIDEATDFKNPKSLRSNGLMKIKEFSLYRMILDGTPVTQGPNDLFIPFSFLNESILGYKVSNFTAFRARYNVMINPDVIKELYKKLVHTKQENDFRDEEIYFAKEIYKIRQAGVFPGYNDLKELLPDRLHYTIGNILSTLGRHKLFPVDHRNIEELYKKIAPHSDRLLLTENIDLPPKLYETLTYELTGDIKKYYNHMKEWLRVKIQNEEMTIKHTLTLYLRLQEMLGGFYTPDESTDNVKREIPGVNTRLNLLIESISKISPSNKIIIWCKFVPEILKVSKELEKIYPGQVIQYYGAVSKTQRQENEMLYRDDPITRFFVGNVATGAKGLNLVAGNYMYYYSRDYNYRLNEQSAFRQHRPGQTKPCIIFDFIAKNTMDEKILHNLSNKKDIADVITGDRFALL